MKKILSFLAAGVLGLGLIGCSGDLHDAELIDLTGYGIRSSGKESGWNEDNDIPLIDNGDGTYSASFTVGDTTAAFAVLKCGDTTWNTAYRLKQPKSQGDKANIFDKAEGMEQKVYLGQSSDCCTIPSASEGDKVNLLITPSYTYLNIKVTVAAGGSSYAEPVPYYFDGIYIVGGCFKTGSMENLWSFAIDNLICGASVNKAKGIVTYIKDIIATATDGEMGFNDSSWGNKLAVTSAIVTADGKDYVVTGKGENGNFKVNGLKIGSPYRVTITTTPEKTISVKIEEIVNYTLTFEITGLEEGMLAWVNGNCWGSGWPNGWPIVDWNNGDQGKTDGYLSAHNYAEADATGVATFDSGWNVTNVAKPGETLSFELKFIASEDDWATTKYNNDNIKFDIQNISEGTYKVSINAEANTVTVTKQ